MSEDPKYRLTDFILQKELGSGSFGKVYAAKYRKTDEIFAVKISFEEITDQSEDIARDISREVDIISKLNHPGVLKFIFYSPTNFREEPYPVIITELAQNGSLDDLIQYGRNNPESTKFDDTQKMIIIYGIASFMSYLHSYEIIHRDLKPDNILIDDFLFPKIADFGLSKIDDILTRSTGNMKGTPIYMAPEIFSSSLYSKASDVYAFSFIVYEIITMERPFKDKHIFQLIHQVIKGARPELPDNVPAAYASLIKSCWDKEPSKRPSFDEIVNKLRNDAGFLTDKINKDEFMKYVKFLDEHKASFDSERKVFYLKTDKKFIKEIEYNIKDLVRNAEAKRGFFTMKQFMLLDEELKKRVEDADGNMEKTFQIAKDLIEGANNFNRNTIVGLQYLKDLIKRGSKEAVIYYAIMLAKGEVIPPDYEKASKLVSSNLNENDSNKHLMMGKIFKKMKNNEKAKECLKKSISLKNAEAMYEYFKILYKEAKTENEKKEAKKYLIDSIKLGFPKSIFKYGMMMKKGEIKEEGKKSAIQYIEEAAEKGCVRAIYNYGMMLSEGDGVKKNFKKAIEYFKKGALKGDAKSISMYGDLIVMDLDELVYDEKAAKLFKAAMDKGLVSAATEYGIMLSLIMADKKEPSKYIRIGIQSRDADALSEAGSILILENNEETVALGIQYLTLAAKKGIVEAMDLLGTVLNIEGNNPDEDPFALYCFEKSVEGGYIDAMDGYASMFLDPEKICFDVERGMAILMEAIEKGNDDAMYLYAHMLQKGELIECDIKESMKYYKMAIDEGNENAMIEYADLIFQKNKKEAIRIYKLAIAKNNADAIRKYAIYLHNQNSKDYNEEVVNLLKRAISKNDTESMKIYADMLQKGEGVIIDEEAAEELYERVISIKENDYDAYYLYANVIASQLMKIKENEGISEKMFAKYERAKNRISEFNTFRCRCPDLCNPEYDEIDLCHSLDKCMKKHIIPRAKKGDGYSLFLYGCILEKGYCFHKDLNKAKKAYKLSADKGVVEAMLAYGKLNVTPNNFDVEINIKEGMKYFKMAADLGNAEALYQYARYYENNGKNDQEEIKQKYKEAIDKNKVDEIYKLGVPLLYNGSIKKTEFTKYIKAAIEKGNTDAMFLYAQLIIEGELDVTPKERTAAKYFKKVADLTGDSDAYIELSSIFKGEKSIEYLKKAVEKGNSNAMFFLALKLMDLNKTLEENKESSKYFHMAIEKGNVAAMSNLIFFDHAEKFFQLELEKKRLYLKGLVEQYEASTDGDKWKHKNLNRWIFDIYTEESLPLYLEAIERGNTDAMVRYAYLLRQHKNKQKEAAEYYEIAASNGNVAAMVICSYLYRTGLGVGINEAKSRGYLRLAKKLELMMLHCKK